MQTIDLVKVDHGQKFGKKCEHIKPNITESCLLREGGEFIGAYIKDASSLSDRLAKLMSLANSEFLSDRVPKSTLKRSDTLQTAKRFGISYAEAEKISTTQYSTIVGSVPKKAHMRRSYHNRSSVHLANTAQTFIKAMLMASNELERVMRILLPDAVKIHSDAVSGIEEKWRFGNLFTSSISNFNISAPFHMDRANLKGTMNAIYTKRLNSTGGCLYVPDYDACFEQPDGSLLIYPAWRNLHGVTPITATHDGGYRNSLVFYALKAFLK